MTCLGWITLRRPYLYSALRQTGRFPLDAALGLVDSYSPGVARWMCRAGTLAGSYQAASQDLLTYAGLEIDGRQIQRMIAQMAPRLTQWRKAQAPVFNPAAGDIFCVSTDGTGAPMRRKDLRGRKGKRGGKARTREVKVGTVFTHRQPENPDERPERDYGSTTYLAEIICAKEFGTLLRAEALRRGIAKAKTVVFEGMGRPGSGPWLGSTSPRPFASLIIIMPVSISCS